MKPDERRKYLSHNLICSLQSKPMKHLLNMNNLVELIPFHVRFLIQNFFFSKKDPSQSCLLIAIWRKVESISVTLLLTLYRLISLVDSVLANGPENRGSIPGWVITKTLKNGTWSLLA